MKTIELKIDDELWDWLEKTAVREQVSVEELIKVLITLESNLRRQTSDGRSCSIKAEIYRGHEPLLVTAYPARTELEKTD
jgi:hypothetical protein